MALDANLSGIVDFLQTQEKENTARWTEGVAQLNAIRTILTNEGRERTTQQTENLNKLQDFNFHLKNVGKNFKSFEKMLDPKKITKVLTKDYRKVFTDIGEGIPVFGKFMGQVGGCSVNYLKVLLR